MRAAIFTASGGPEVIKITDVPDPVLRGNEVLVRVKASGLNRAEILQRRGFYPAPPGAPENIPGLEFAGVVEKIGTKVKSVSPGQRVFGLTGGGSQAEHITVDARLTLPIPDNLDFITAAAIPEAYATAADAIYNQLVVTPGSSVLVHAIGSSVGIALLQVLKTLSCQVFGTSRSPAKLKKASALGLDVSINSLTDDFAAVVKSKTNGDGVSACVDFIGAPFFAKNLDALAFDGKLLILGLMGGTSLDFDLNQLLIKRVKVLATSMRTLPTPQKVKAIQIFAQKVLPAIISKKIVPVVDKVFKLEDLAQAHRYMESNANFGKIVISIS